MGVRFFVRGKSSFLGEENCMSDNKSFDLIVIGGGMGGNGVVWMVVDVGWKVVSIDVFFFGGICVL